MARHWLTPLIVLFTFFSLTSVSAFAQDTGEALPAPEVIDIWPLPGVELGGSEPLTISFDQPMDEASTTAAFSLLPDVAGETTWPDARTLQFTPLAGWPRQTELLAAVAATAESAAGVPMDSAYQSVLRTIGPLEVGTVSPTPDDSAVAADARIVVTFNRPVVALGSTADMAALPSPIEITPQVDGSGEWVNTSIFSFTPANGLEGSTKYTVRVLPGIQSVDGATLDDGYTWTFSTLPPEVLRVTPASGQDRVGVANPVSIEFSQPMDPTSVEMAFSLSNGGGSVIGTFSWNDDYTQVTFTPSADLERDTMYTVSLAGSARSANGNATLDQTYSTTFTTFPFPRVQSTTPRDGQTGIDPMYSSVSILFSTPINFETVVDHIHISPEPDEWFPEMFLWDRSRVFLNFDAAEMTTYNVTVDAGVEDLDGNASAEPYTFSFTTGPIDAEAYPIINGNFVITNANRDDTRIAMMTSGRGFYSVDVYQLAPEDASGFTGANFNDYISYSVFDSTFSAVLPAWATSDRLIRSVNSEFDTDGKVRVPEEVLLASDNGGQLATGLYWVVVYSSDPAPMVGSNSFQFALAVVDTNVTVKRGPETTVVWLTDLPTGEPVADTPVTIYHAAESQTGASAGEVLATAVTGADGSVSIPLVLPEEDDVIYVLAESDTAFGAWYSNRTMPLPTERGYLYTDRPIYRPSETVYFRGIARDRHDMDFSVPDRNTIHVTVRHPWQEDVVFAEMDVEVSSFGTFSGSYEIPTDQELGDIAIVADAGDGVSFQYGYLGEVWNLEGQTMVVFTVADFRPPEFEVSVTPQTETIIQGDPAVAIAEASYYAGGAVNNANVSYRAYGQNTGFTYQGEGRFTFTDTSGTGYNFFNDLIAGESTTDEDGRVVVTVDNTTAPRPLPMEIIIEATIMDEANQPSSATTTILAHPANVYVGLRNTTGFVSAGTATTFDVLTVTPDSEPVIGQPVEIEVFLVNWKPVELPGQPGRFHWQEERTLVATDSVTTAAEGRTTYTFTPSGAGRYLVRATTRDAQERLNAAATSVYVTSDEQVYWGQPSQSMELQPDKQGYVPGETATVLIPLPTDDQWSVLVTAERAGVMTHEVVSVDGTTLLYELPLDESFAPTVYLTATAIRAGNEDDPNPTYATGEVRLDVAPVHERLTVEAVPSTTLAEPQGEVTFDLTATDAKGEPVQAEIGLALVDKAVLALLPPNSTTLEETFYGTQRNYVITEVALSGLIDALTDAVFPGGRGGGGGGGGGAPYIRDDFEFTPLWAPHVVTDENGQASVSVTLPDNLTTWQLDARAVTLDTQVGQTTTEIMSTLPLRVSPVAPRFFVAGDRAELGVIVFNNTGEPQTVDVRLDATGVTLESEQTQTVTIEAGSRTRVDWTAVVQDVPGVDLVFSARSESGHQDAARPLLTTGPDNTIPVYVYSAPDTTGTGGVLRDGGATTEAISLPARLAGAGGELEITLSPSLAAAMTDALDVIENTPCDCTERVVSKLLANVATYRANQLTGAAMSPLQYALQAEIDAGIALLRERQYADGSWSWVEGVEQGDPLVTAYAALALVEAEQAGFSQLRGVINSATAYVQRNMVPVGPNVPAWQLNRQAFYLYVLSRASMQDVGVFNALMGERLRLSLAARAYLLMSLSTRPDAAASAALLGDLTSAAILSANGAHWEEANRDWYNWGSDTRTTALVLNAIAGADPNNALLPNAVRWLVQARRGDHWVTTQETAWSVMALANWMTLTGELDAYYGYETRLNGDTVVEAQVAPNNVRDSQTLRVSVANLLRDSANRLTIARTEGEGALHYSTYLNLTLPADEVDALSRGVTVEREYYLNGDRNRPTTQAQVGDIITVRVTLTLPQDIPYFAFEDPIPAGTESIDPNLLTTSTAAQSPRLALQLEDDPFWYFGWWWFDRTELRDARTLLFADYLPRGTYVYTYQLRATLAGEFKVMPAHASALYQPDVFGRTAGSIFTVLPNNDATPAE